MKRMLYRNVLTLAVSLAFATGASGAATAADGLEEFEETPVLAERINARERTEFAEPALTYSKEYFRRFEPLSGGEMLKRVPGVTFADDIGEYAAASLRGIGAECTDDPAFPQHVLIALRSAHISRAG